MATEGDVDLDLEGDENCTGKPAEKPRKHDSGAADLERVTDYAEEKEISSSDLQTAMSVIGDRRSREQKAKQEREKELAKVTIKKEDVELISCCDIDVRDGDFKVHSRTKSARTHGQRSGSSGGSDQLKVHTATQDTVFPETNFVWIKSSK
ncbi:huntingtin-interacting protein K isoform X1 [Syngnathoides biaculeatus]|uniref:huntingtin-interacting protein K isoform X1 n=1 Tax=Syngnathoides biaculeatus TaxID=300417 RepID=UPI002ADE832A|nr:huntingtin-interacting protein K isoform X1 [Syngnathoides biaculeatus]